MSVTNNSNALAQLRQHMVDNKVDFYYVPTSDDHNNEYVPAYWQRREWLTGFTGSYGQALVGVEAAYLWTDSRYYLQAAHELDATQFQMMKQIQGVTAPIISWLLDNAKDSIVAVDPRVISIREFEQWSDRLQAVGSQLKPIAENFVDHVWGERPSLNLSELYLLPEANAGVSAVEKMSRVRQVMRENQADALVLTMLDEIAWLFNVRANDVPFNPIAISYALVTQDKAMLFTELSRVPENVSKQLEHEGVSLLPYEAFSQVLRTISGSVWVDPATASMWVKGLLPAAKSLEKTSPIVMMKAIKNTVELAGAKEAHRLDALAVVKFLHWLENNWQSGLTEVAAADQLEAFRRENPACKDLSFDTICGFADHGAIVHYRATPDIAHQISDTNLLLVDSGGQYFEGTTDITRTIHLGDPTIDQKRHYTLVLKGHLALRHAVFPDGVCGEHLNAIARQPIWAQGMDFGHGTGHGVGAYLCVHEGPQRISIGYTGVPLKPGMIVSNEPGLYFDGQYGIRIENLCAITQAYSAAESATDHGPFYTLEDLTMVPYARKLIDKAMLSAQEIAWVNDYHQKIFDLLSKDLPQHACAWLKHATQPL